MPILRFPPRLRAWTFALGAALLAAALMASACSGGPATPTSPRDVTFMAGFKPQANLPFVAAYVAQEKGYFAEQGLNVDIRHASSGEHLKLLLAGDVQFTTADAASVLRRRSDPGVPIRAFVLFGQKGQQAFVAVEGSGINTLNDFEGKKVGYKVSVPPEYLAMLKAAGVDRSKAEEVRVGFDPRVLTEGRVDVLAVFKSNEPDTLKRLGFPVRVFDPADYGVPTLGLTYITHEDTVSGDPETVDRFLKATLKGVEFARQNEEETLDIVLRFAPSEDREHQRFMLRAELADAKGPVVEEKGFGSMTDGQWKALYDHLIEFEALPNPVDYRTAFDDSFLERVYEDGKLVWP